MLRAYTHRVTMKVEVQMEVIQQLKRLIRFDDVKD